MKKIIFYFSLVLLLVSCENNSGSPGNNYNSQPAQAASIPSVNVGYVTPIPIVNGSAPQVSAVITNNSNSKLTLQSSDVSIVNQPGNAAAAQASAYYSVDQCKSIPVGGTCNLTLLPQNKPISYIVRMTFIDSNGNQYPASQMISYANTSAVNGYYLTNNTITTVIPQGQYSTITIPFVLAANYTNVTAASSLPVESLTTTCNNYNIDGQCQIEIKVKGMGVTFNPTITLNGKEAIPLVITSNNVANLLTSSNVSILQGTPTTVTLFNSGLANTGPISVSLSNKNSPISVVPSPKCSQGVESGASCTLTLKANSSQNTFVTIIVSYGAVTNSFIANYYANPNTNPPGIAIINNNQNAFNYVVDNKSTYGPMVIQVTNSGTVTLNNLQIGDITKLESAITIDQKNTTCGAGQPLGVGESCNLAYDYTPDQPESKSLPVYFSGDYLNNSGESVTYSSGPLNILVNAVPSLAAVSVTANPNPVTIQSNDQQTATFKMKVINLGSITATNVQVTPINFNLVTQGSNSCTKNSLDPGESCTTTYTFGPVPANESGVYLESQTVSYLNSPIATFATTSTGPVQLTAAYNNNYVVTNIPQAPKGLVKVVAGDTESVNIYFNTNDDNQAQNLTLSNLNLPSGWESTSFSCPHQFSNQNNCILTLTYTAPNSNESGQISESFTYTNAVGFNLTGSFQFNYVTTGRFAYLTNAKNYSINYCKIDENTDMFQSCKSQSIPQFPVAVIYKNGRLYYGDYNNGVILECNTNPDGTFDSNCVSNGPGGQQSFGNPRGVVFNGDLDVYIADMNMANPSADSLIWHCQVDSESGTFHNCSSYDSGTHTASGLAIYNGYLYITSACSNSTYNCWGSGTSSSSEPAVTYCKINPDDGSIPACSNAINTNTISQDSVFYNPYGIAFNGSGVYIGNFYNNTTGDPNSNQTIQYCTLNGGLLTTCTTVSPPNGQAGYMGISSLNMVNGGMYVLDHYAGEVYYCPDSTGSLNCVLASSSVSLPNVEMMTFTY